MRKLDAWRDGSLYEYLLGIDMTFEIITDVLLEVADPFSDIRGTVNRTVNT